MAQATSPLFPAHRTPSPEADPALKVEYDLASAQENLKALARALGRAAAAKAMRASISPALTKTSDT
jgi:hypothetical protein